jgi:phosphate starvation-inducible PhoH-like protein
MKMNFFKFFVVTLLFKKNNSFKNIVIKNFSTAIFSKKKGLNNSYFYTPKSINQEKYVELLDDNKCKIILGIGPAGTGKTLFACQKAITQLKSDEINKIVITRPVVTVEEDIGFLPGNIIKKMDPWTKPIFDIFLEQYSKTELDSLLNNNKIEICPLAFMRGRTFKNAFIIADEMQNSSPNQMKMLTTRIGYKSRMVITGDLKQSDMLKDNGLNDFLGKIKKFNNNNNSSKLINMVEFESTDIERSEIVKKVIEIYDYEFKSIQPVDNRYNNYSLYESYLFGDAALLPRKDLSRNFNKFSS